MENTGGSVDFQDPDANYEANTVLLGKIPGTDIYRDLHHYKESVKIPGFLILSIEAPINFANSKYWNERLVCTNCYSNTGLQILIEW